MSRAVANGKSEGEFGDRWAASGEKYLQRALLAEEKLACALDRERALQQQLDSNAQADKTRQGKLDLNLCTLAQKVSEMKRTLLERDLAIQRSERIIAQLEQQKENLQKQLENTDKKLIQAASNLDKSANMRIVEFEQPGAGGGSGVRGVKSVFKTLLMLNEEEGSGMISVPRSVIDDYRSQMAELEHGLRAVQSFYIPREVHDTELAACQEMWAGKLERYKQASRVQVMGLKQEIAEGEVIVTRLASEIAVLQQQAVEAQWESSSLRSKLQKKLQFAETGHGDDHDLHQALSHRELERRRAYDVMEQGNSQLKHFLAETATSVITVKDAVEFRAEAMRQLIVENEELALKIVSLENELEQAHCTAREIVVDGHQQLEAALSALGQAKARVACLEQANLNLEGLLTLSRQGEKDCQAELEAMKEGMQVEKLKAITAELQNVGLRKDAELPTVWLEESEQQVAVLKEELRLMEENHKEELKRYAQIMMEESQERERLYGLAFKKLENTKTAEETRNAQCELEFQNANLVNVERLESVKAEAAALAAACNAASEVAASLVAEIRCFETTVVAVMQDTVLLISEKIKDDMDLKNIIQDSTIHAEELKVIKESLGEMEEMSKKISELEDLLKNERSEREKERRALSVTHTNPNEVIEKLEERLSIAEKEKEEISSKFEGLVRKAMDALKNERHEREIEKVEFEGKLSTAEMEKAELLCKLSEMEGLVKKTMDALQSECFEREKEREDARLECEKEKMEMESLLNFAEIAEGELTEKLSTAGMEKTELKRVLQKFMNLLKTELSEREKDLKEKAEMARKILQMEGALKQVVDEPQNDRAAEELRTSDAQLLQLKQELAEASASESAWEESKRELEDELHRVKSRLTEELACKSCNRYRKHGPFKK